MLVCHKSRITYSNISKLLAATVADVESNKL